MGLHTLVIINPFNSGNDHQRLDIALLSTVIADTAFTNFPETLVLSGN